MRQRRLSQWAFFSGLSILVALVGLLAFDRFTISLLEPLLKPWFAFCGLLTPDAWEVRGNLLLGMGVMLSGVLGYSMLLGGIVTGLAAFFEGMGRRTKEPKTTT